MMRGMPTAYGGAATTANPYASALTYEQLLARNNWLESALRDIEARRAFEAGASAGYAAGAAVFSSAAAPGSGSAAAPGVPDGAADGANAVETALFAEAPAPAAPAVSAPASVPEAGTNGNTANGTPPGIIIDETELLAEAPAHGSGPITDGKGVSITSVGYSFEKRFKGHGWFKGKVVEIRPGAAGGKDRRCEYEDGDMEDLSLHQLRSLYHATQKKMKNQQGRAGASAASEFGTSSRGETKTDNGDMEDLSLRQLRSLAGSAFGT